jgi:hypothetical protein
VEVPLGWLLEHGVEAWMGPDSLPLTLPEHGYEGFAARSGAAATAAGLRRRPLAETLADTLSYERELGLDRDRTAGLSPATERRLLAEWTASHGTSVAHDGAQRPTLATRSRSPDDRTA